MNKQSGFSLTELVVVLAVMSILAVFATSSFSSYSAKTQVAEAFKITEALRGQYATYYAEAGKRPPLTLADLFGTGDGSLANHHVGSYINSVTIDGGDIVVTYGGSRVDPALTGKTLVMSAYESVSGNILWRCGLAPVPDDGGSPATQLGRAGTRAGAAATGTATATTVEVAHLPRDCRT